MSEPTVTSTQAPEPVRPAAGKRSGKFGRRALIGAAAVSVCAAGVALAPAAEQALQAASKKAIDDAYAAGIAAGRQALMSELAQLEGVPLDVAITVAEVTRMAVLYIVRPVAGLFATIAGDALALLLAGLSSAKSNLASINVHISQLDQLTALLTSWKNNITQLPIQITDYTTHDIDSAENYLKALKRHIQSGK
ncbi:MAG TPA: hypothetical protein VF808_06070 [Ktedonobacterales bacterium]